MKKVLNPQIEAGSRDSHEPRLVGSIVSEMLQSWKHNTHLGVDLKTHLRSDACAKAGKSYKGVLRRDEICEDFHYEEHFTFTESVPSTEGKRNVHVFKGRYITITLKNDGTLRPNFKPIPTGEGFSLERYALGVYNEICLALAGLIEEA